MKHFCMSSCSSGVGPPTKDPTQKSSRNCWFRTFPPNSTHLYISRIAVFQPQRCLKAIQGSFPYKLPIGVEDSCWSAIFAAPPGGCLSFFKSTATLKTHLSTNAHETYRKTNKRTELYNNITVKSFRSWPLKCFGYFGGISIRS